MTELEWLASTDPLAMIDYIADDGSELGKTHSHIPISNRKLRLFAIAAFRHTVPELAPEELAILHVAEKLADGVATDEELYAAYRADRLANTPPRNIHATVLLHRATANHTWGGRFIATGVIEYAPAVRDDPAGLAAIVREIAGNPFRPVTLCGMARKPFHNQFTHVNAAGSFWLEVECPACAELRTPTLVSLATAAYEERNEQDGTLDPLRLMVLADVMEEAGCTDDAILRHLRGFESWVLHPRGQPDYVSGGRMTFTPHYRGCWALDTILGLIDSP